MSETIIETQAANTIETRQKPAKPNAFKSYSSLENHTVIKFVEHIRYRGYDAKEIEWQATEKIHGCNFSVAYDGTTIRYGRRSGWLTADEKFMGYQILIPTLNDNVKRVWTLLKKEKPELTSIHLYGELFGGKYIHPQVKPARGISCIQTDIQYCPDLRYHVFDILCDYQYFLNCDDLARVCETTHVDYAKPIARGTMDEILAFPIENQLTRIPETLGLPPIAKNYWEGIVIRPIHSLYCGNGSRVLLKMKTQRFLEVARIPKTVRNAVEAASKSITQAAIEGVQQYVTRPRLVTVLSKIDISTIPQLSAELLPMFVQDVMCAFRTDNAELCTSLPPDQDAALTKFISRLCGKMIFTNRDSILNKTFSIDERKEEEKDENVDGIEANLATTTINQTISTITTKTETTTATATATPTEIAPDHNTPLAT